MEKHIRFSWKLDPIVELCRKHHAKLHALRCIRPFLSKEKARLLTNAFIHCQFLYASLIWMFASKNLISKIYKIYSRALQIVHNVHAKF